jgi:hypothetical protein
LYSYEVLSSSEWGFNKSFSPSVFYELSEKDVSAKWGALKKYSTETGEWPHPRSKRGVFSLASLRGMQSGFKYAEAFRLVRSFR